MIHNSERLWLSISVVWAATLAALLLGSLFFVISNGRKTAQPGQNRWGRFFCLPPQPPCMCGEPLAVALPTDRRRRFTDHPT
jgi:hypothetical protein